MFNDWNKNAQDPQGLAWLVLEAGALLPLDDPVGAGALADTALVLAQAEGNALRQ